MTDNVTPAPTVIAAYTWRTSGTCFRCGRSEVETAEVGYLAHRSIAACATCLLVMERHREAAAHRYGWPYVPGTPAPEACRGADPGQNP